MFNTGNPVPSTDFRDLSDNSETMDSGMNSVAASFLSRLGVARKTWAGMEADFQTEQTARAATFTASEASRTATFNAGEATRAALTANLANSSDPAKGAALVGYSGTTVKTTLDTLAASASPTFNAMTLTSGQLQFPAVQVPSANANCLDDYEEGTWTPTLTFTTVGNLSVVYVARLGIYTKVGRICHLSWKVQTSTFTWTTSTGSLRITGLPFATAAVASVPAAIGSLAHDGPTFPANYVTLSPFTVELTTQLGFYQSSGAAGLSILTQANSPTATNYALFGSITYPVA